MREHLKTILDKYRDEDHKIEGEWWPVSVFCSNCDRDTTQIDGWDGDWGLSYHCESCGHSETGDIPPQMRQALLAIDCKPGYKK
jgi:lysyl-tRNA synthetase class 1